MQKSEVGEDRSDEDLEVGAIPGRALTESINQTYSGQVDEVDVPA